MVENKFQTEAGKELRIHKVVNSALFGVNWANGGELPEEFKNAKFTSPKLAEEAILKYLNTRKKSKVG